MSVVQIRRFNAAHGLAGTFVWKCTISYLPDRADGGSSHSSTWPTAIKATRERLHRRALHAFAVGFVHSMLEEGPKETTNHDSNHAGTRNIIVFRYCSKYLIYFFADGSYHKVGCRSF